MRQADVSGAIGMGASTGPEQGSWCPWSLPLLEMIGLHGQALPFVGEVGSIESKSHV